MLLFGTISMAFFLFLVGVLQGRFGSWITLDGSRVWVIHGHSSVTRGVIVCSYLFVCRFVHALCLICWFVLIIPQLRHHHGTCFVDVSCGNLPNACSRKSDCLVDGVELVVQLWACVGRPPQPLHHRVQDLLHVRYLQSGSIHTYFLHVSGDGRTYT